MDVCCHAGRLCGKAVVACLCAGKGITVEGNCLSSARIFVCECCLSIFGINRHIILIPDYKTRDSRRSGNGSINSAVVDLVIC